MTSSQQKPMFTALLIASVAVVVYLFCIEPARQTLEKARRDYSALNDQRDAMFRDLKGAAQVKDRLNAIETSRRPYLDALLTPLLESYAMRAKSFLDPLAADACVQIKDYEELDARALPLVKPQAPQLYARKPIRVKCVGTYAEIVSFLMRVEKMLPMVTLQAFSLKVQNTPDEQTATLVFEWPVKGANTAVAAAAKGGVKK